jgi:NADH-quinone oxidoreductase subunit G
MFGAVAKETLPRTMGVPRENSWSSPSCRARPRSSRRSARIQNRRLPDVDFVLTTQELAAMIEQAGLHFRDLEPESFELPFGFKTGAGVIFGNTAASRRPCALRGRKAPARKARIL